MTAMYLPYQFSSSILSSELALVPVSDMPVYNVQAYGATGDGVTDDTAAINATFAAAAATPGAFVVFPATAAFYLITGPISVLATATILGGCGVTIAQQTQLTPVFDLFNVNNCLISGLTLTLTGGPFTGMGSGFRGDAKYAYSAGIWTNGSGHTFRDLLIQNFCMGVYFSSCNSGGTALTATLRTNNTVSNVEIIGANHGVLAMAQLGLQIHSLYSHDHFDSSAGVNPTHGIYLTGNGASNAVNYDIIISNCLCRNNATGQGFQFKFTQGVVATNMIADNCNGLFDGADIYDATLTGWQSVNDAASIVPSFTIQKYANQPARINITGLSITMGNDYIPFSVIADDVRIADVVIFSNHTGVATTSYDMQIRGNNIVVDGVKIHNLGTSQYKGISVGVHGYATSNVTISNIDVNNMLSVCDFDGAVTGVNVIDYSPASLRNVPMTGTYYIDQVYGTAAFATVRHPWTTIKTVTAGAVATGALCPYPPLETTTVFAVADSTAFAILAPRCRPQAGMKQEVAIFNQSGGALGVITWNPIYIFRSTFDPPANGQIVSVTFYFDGMNWRELAPSMPALT